MKISVALYALGLAQEEAADSVEVGLLEPRYSGYEYDYGYDYYIDAEGRKKKKGAKENDHHHHNEHNNPMHNSHGGHGGQHGSQSAWNDAVMNNAHFGYGKGYQFDQDLIGNGRFCWNCYARMYKDGDGIVHQAYDNCFDGGMVGEGHMEMCVGEEYFCSWEERRYKGVIVAVSGGCKSAQSCLRQMTENWRWRVYQPGSPALAGNLCRAGNFGDETENSVCAWCCDAMPPNLNRFAPATTMMCNGREFTGTIAPPAHVYENSGTGTDDYPWSTVGDLFRGLYDDGQYHGLFRIHDQYPLGYNRDANMPYPHGRTGAPEAAKSRNNGVDGYRT